MTTAKTLLAEWQKLFLVSRYIVRQYLSLFAGRSWPRTRFFTSLLQEAQGLAQREREFLRVLPSTLRKRPYGLPKIEASALLAQKEEVGIELYNDARSLLNQHPTFNGAFLTLNEQIILNTLIRDRAPKTIFEFGTALGFTAYNFLLNAPDDSVIYTLDLEDLRHHSPTIQSGFKSSRLVSLLGDSAKFNFDSYSGKIDFIFIDANHEEAWVRADSLNALRMLSPNGIILWHDYHISHPGVLGVLNELGKSLSIKHINGTSLAVLH